MSAGGGPSSSTSKPKNVAAAVTQATGIHHGQVLAASRLYDDGCTIPFIARYRQDETGGLDESQLRVLRDELCRVTKLEATREKALEEAWCVGHIRSQVEAAEKESEVKEIAKEHKTTRKSKVTEAAERVGDLLEQVMQGRVVDEQACENNLEDLRALLIDILWKDRRVRRTIADVVLAEGFVETALTKQEAAKAGDPDEKLLKYQAFRSRLATLPGYAALAISRHTDAKRVTRKITLSHDDDKPADCLLKRITSNWFEPGALARLDDACWKAAHKKALAASKNVAWKDTVRRAEMQAVSVFETNLSHLLSRRPAVPVTVLALDPGFKHGTKCAVVSGVGKVLDTFVVHPLPPAAREGESRETLRDAIAAHSVGLVAVGDGCGGTQVEQFLRRAWSLDPSWRRPMARVSECGASVYSASELGKKESPTLGVAVRSAVFLARCVLNPLSERCKVPPIHLGVGQYQHDLNKTELSSSLVETVTSIVGRAGIDVNTASAHVMKYIPGLNSALANRLVATRENTGAFKSREELKQCKGMGPKTFEQCAGFLRVYGGSEWLDESGVHPEWYAATRKLLRKCGVEGKGKDNWDAGELAKMVQDMGGFETAGDVFGVGERALRAIVREVENVVTGGGRDKFEAPSLLPENIGIESIDASAVGTTVTGVVSNVVDWGSFVDIGCTSGLMRHKAAIGDIVTVRIQSISPQGKVFLQFSPAGAQGAGQAQAQKRRYDGNGLEPRAKRTASSPVEAGGRRDRWTSNARSAAPASRDDGGASCAARRFRDNPSQRLPDPTTASGSTAGFTTRQAACPQKTKRGMEDSEFEDRKRRR
ncbi:hypothetical protein DIPPA_35492 [Diplonema papillatum]|nr:hypothetical protein DIPPA_02376 [Diplonema papillatum]KAJ9446299.1 hypothetical protein DIPPA_35492 [Diplonema papillatum]